MISLLLVLKEEEVTIENILLSLYFYYIHSYSGSKVKCPILKVCK